MVVRKIDAVDAAAVAHARTSQGCDWCWLFRTRGSELSVTTPNPGISPAGFFCNGLWARMLNAGCSMAGRGWPTGPEFSVGKNNNGRGCLIWSESSYSPFAGGGFETHSREPKEGYGPDPDLRCMYPPPAAGVIVTQICCIWISGSRCDQGSKTAELPISPCLDRRRTMKGGERLSCVPSTDTCSFAFATASLRWLLCV